MRHALLVPVLLCTLVTSLSAQDAPALRGTVRDSTGRPLAGVEVSYRNTRTLSDSVGNFRLTPVPTGRITVRFTRAGVSLGTLEAEVTADTTSGVQVDVVGDRSEPRTLLGTVVDASGRPVKDVTIEVVTALTEGRTDSLGRFSIRNLPARRHIVRVRRVGYSPTYLTADLTDSTSTRARIVLRAFAGQNLGLVIVRADRGTGRMRGFLERASKRSGWGKILTADDIARRNPMRASDMLVGLAGVRVTQSRNGGSVLTGRNGCLLLLFINGFPTPQRSGAGLDEMVSALDLAGIEVYNSNAGVPAELTMGAPSPCGTVGIWTR